MARSTLSIAGGKSQQFTILNIDTIFNFYRPKPPLSKFVDSFWLYEGYNPERKTERILPTGTLELVINLRQFDQSHFIREFLEFSGLSPTDYINRHKRFIERNIHVNR